MPTVTSSSLLGRVTQATATATARLLATTEPPIDLPTELMATINPYYYSTTSRIGTRINSIIRTGPMISSTTTTTTTTTPASIMSGRMGAELGVVSSSPMPTTPSLYSLDELAHWSTTSEYASLVHALLASFSVILVSELGDKTFIITAIMAMKNSRSLVFVSSALALLLMTVLSVGMGVAVTVIPEVYTHYASIVLFLCFGLKMLMEAYDMTRAGSEPGESEFDEVKRSLEDFDDTDGDDVKLAPNKTNDEVAPAEKQLANLINLSDENLINHAEKTASVGKLLTSHNWYGGQLRQTIYVAPIIIKVFTMVFVAEWGDRSQISTVILAAREDVIGVFIGSLTGHVFCTGLAVIGGRFVADMISVRTMTLLGGIIFLLFAAFEILMGPGEQV